MNSDDQNDRPDDFPFLGDLTEEDFVRELLGSLDDDRPEQPVALPDRTIRKVQAELTSRDLVDLTTFVFLVRFCAPLLDLLAAFFGHDPLSPPESMQAQRTRPESPRPDRDPTSRSDDPGELADELEEARTADASDRRHEDE